MKLNNILEISLIANDKDTFRGKITAQYSEDTIVDIEMEKIKLNDVDFVHTEIPSVSNGFLFHFSPGYSDELKLYAESIGKESVTFSELVDYLKERNELLLGNMKKLQSERLKEIKEANRRNGRYKKIINSLQKTIGRLINIDK